jgi:hypothetical protein
VLLKKPGSVDRRVGYAPWFLARTKMFKDTHYQVARLDGLHRKVWAISKDRTSHVMNF